MSMSMTGALFGRDSELQLVHGLIDRAADRGGALVIRGDPGVGKTALLSDAAARAGDRGLLVLKAVGVHRSGTFTSRFSGRPFLCHAPRFRSLGPIRMWTARSRT